MAFSNPATATAESSNPSKILNPSTTTSAISNHVTAAFVFSNPTTTASAISNPTTSTSALFSPTTSAFAFSNLATKGSTFPSFQPRPQPFPRPQFGMPSHPNSSGMKPHFNAMDGRQMMTLSRKKPRVDASTQTERQLRVSKFRKGLKEMLLSSKHSDFVLNAEGEEFRVHKIILEAHSPVFAAMMEHDTKENAIGIANIDDFEPLTIRNFLDFLYTGTVENLNSDNVIDLYKAADKYQVKELCDLCVEYMSSNISVENFCDILNLSLRHHVSDLTEVATQFFVRNSKEIAVTVKWGTFLSQNPVAGNELFLKALHSNNMYSSLKLF